MAVDSINGIPPECGFRNLEDWRAVMVVNIVNGLSGIINAYEQVFIGGHTTKAWKVCSVCGVSNRCMKTIGDRTDIIIVNPDSLEVTERLLDTAVVSPFDTRLS